MIAPLNPTRAEAEVFSSGWKGSVVAVNLSPPARQRKMEGQKRTWPVGETRMRAGSDIWEWACTEG